MHSFVAFVKSLQVDGDLEIQKKVKLKRKLKAVQQQEQHERSQTPTPTYSSSSDEDKVEDFIHRSSSKRRNDDSLLQEPAEKRYRFEEYQCALCKNVFFSMLAFETHFKEHLESSSNSSDSQEV